MKRLFIFLTALTLLVSLFACAQKPTTGEPDSDAAPPSPAEPIVLSQLNVEFVKGERSTDALLRLKKEFPPLLITALAEQGVAVEAVSITFGANAEATAQALAAGSVQLGFLPTSVCCAHFGEVHAVADRVGAGSALIGLYLPYGEQNKSLLEKLTPTPWGKAFTAEDLKAAHWALPALDDAALRYLTQLLEENYALSPDALENISYYSDLAERDAAIKSANFIVLYGFDALESSLYAVLENLPLEGETVAVSAADEDVSSEAFRAAVQNALEALCLDEAGQAVLSLYSDGEVVNYHAVNDGAYASQRYVLGYAEE